MRFENWLRELRRSAPRVSKHRRSRLSTATQSLETRTLLSTFTVNSTADTVDANPGDGLAEDADGMTTLRAAVMESNAVAGGDKIILPAGTYTLTLKSERDIDVTRRTTIVGAGAATTIIDANGISRVLHVHDRATLNLKNVTLTGGTAKESNGGGGILSLGTVTIQDSIIRGNSAEFGAGIHNSGGQLEISSSAITENVATLSGGGAIQQPRHR